MESGNNHKGRKRSSSGGLRTFMLALAMISALVRGVNATELTNGPKTRQQIEQIASEETMKLYDRVEAEAKSLNDLIEHYADKIRKIEGTFKEPHGRDKEGNEIELDRYVDDFYNTAERFISDIKYNMEKIKTANENDEENLRKYIYNKEDSGYVYIDYLLKKILNDINWAHKKITKEGNDVIRRITCVYDWQLDNYNIL